MTELDMPVAGQPAPRQLMDDIYRRQRFFYDLTRKYYLLGRDRLIDGLDIPPGGTVLELGCGTGRNLITAARRYPTARCYGLDLSDEMLKSARTAVSRAGHDRRISIAQADATNFDALELFGRNRFDRVFVSYSLSMIPAWPQALVSGLVSLRAGGSLHVVDFGMQERLPRWFGNALRAWLAKFHVTPRGNLEDVMRVAAARNNATLEFHRLYLDYARYGIIRSVS